MFWLGALPALLVLWVRNGVEESPVWLERRQHLEDTRTRDRLSLIAILRPGLLGVTIQTSMLMGAFMFSYYSVTYWYATFLRESDLAPFWYVIALNIGGIAGDIVWGHFSETGLGRRGAVAVAILVVTVLVAFRTRGLPPRPTLLELVGLGGAGARRLRCGGNACNQVKPQSTFDPHRPLRSRVSREF